MGGHNYVKIKCDSYEDAQNVQSRCPLPARIDGHHDFTVSFTIPLDNFAEPPQHSLYISPQGNVGINA